MIGRWHFNTMRRGDKAREPIQSEFFSMDAIGGPGVALVREGIQNSLDARRDGEKVIVRIRVSGTNDAVSRNDVAPFLDGLAEHLGACGNGLRETPRDDEDCPVLVFEDFGTTGLTGDPAEWRPESGSGNHFYHFFRAEGRSDKGEKDRGRWGVGKQVFLGSSRINILFGLTVRSDDARKLLMGMSVLKSHDVNKQRYTPDGWFGRRADGDGGLVFPIEEPTSIQEFCRVFGIKRGDEPGLSVVVPWYDLDLTDEDLLRAVVDGYFWPILQGKLEVTIETSAGPINLQAGNLIDTVREVGGDLAKQTAPLCELAAWANQQTDDTYVTLNAPEDWRWKPSVFAGATLTSLREAFERGDRIALRIEITVTKLGEQERRSFLNLFLHRDGSDYTGKPVYIREGIIIPEVRKYGASLLRGIRSLVVAEDRALAALLGDAENPAHMAWERNGKNFKEKYKDGAKIIDCVSQCPMDIVRILYEQDKKEDRTLLADIFSVPAVPDDPHRVKGRKTPKSTPLVGTDPEEPSPPDPRPRPFIIERIESGFVVRNGNMNGAAPPSEVLIEAAYDVRRGNAFRKYHPADFDLSQRMKTDLEGARVIEKKANRLRVSVLSPLFRIGVTGFDHNRDVKVKVRKGGIAYADSDD